MSKYKNQATFILVVLIIFIVGFIWVEINPNTKLLTANLQDLKIKYVEIAGKKIAVDLATTPDSQAQGLSGRTALAEEGGMLFIFDNSGDYGFWMKDMNFSIDIIWLDADGKVVHIQKSASPESYPKVFEPGKNAKYVLEVTSGFSEKNNLKEGDKATFDF